MRFVLALVMVALCACRPAPTTVRLVTFQGAEAPLLARQLGLFSKAGLQVDLQETQGTAKAMEALLGGSADSIIGTYEQAVQIRAQGKRVVAYRLLTECHCLALVASPGKKIERVEDLGGKTVGVGAPGGSMQTFVSYLLDRAGVAEASYVAVGVGATAFAAVDGGKVDAAVVLASTLTRLRERYPDLRVLAETFSEDGSRQAFGFSSYPSMALLASGDWLDRHPDTARRLSDSLGEAITWIHTHTAEETRAKLGGNLDLSALKLHLPRYSKTGAIEPITAEFVRRQLEHSRKIEPNAVRNVAETYTNEFVKPNHTP